MQKNTPPVTLESLHAEIQELKALVRIPSPIQSLPIPPPLNESSLADLLTPTEVCKVLKISRSQFERMKRNNFFKIHRLNIKGRKIYVSRSELSHLFRNDFAA